MTMHSKFGYSAVSMFEQCPFRYELQYIEKMRTLPTDDAANALVLGTVLHDAVENDIDGAIGRYFNRYPIIDDLHINEEIKLRYLIPKLKEMLPDGEHEIVVRDDNFIGTLDLLTASELTIEQKDNICGKCNNHHDCGYYQSGVCPHGKYDNFYDIYDFKYSNNVERYLESRQLHLYKYYWEKRNPSKKVRNLYFVFIPKIQIRQKKTETLYEFRKRLTKELENASLRKVRIDYDVQKVIDHLELTQQIMCCEGFEKNPTKLCNWCDYRNYCEKGDLIDMILPSTQPVAVDMSGYKKIWLYGEPFSGKTHLAAEAQAPILELNTDGNIKYYTMPRVSIVDTVEGRQTIPAWKVFLNTLDELRKGSDFKTIVVDLIDDIYDACRKYICNSRGWEHESDDSFKAYDIIRTEFLRAVRELMDLPCNVILISHEDASRDLTKRSNDKVTRIQPNIPEKVAKKVAGMVDVVIRVVRNGNEYTLSTKCSDVVFGGGRLSNMQAKSVPNSWSSVELMYDTTPEITPQQIVNAVKDTGGAQSGEVSETREPTRRTRRRMEVE